MSIYICGSNLAVMKVIAVILNSLGRKLSIGIWDKDSIEGTQKRMAQYVFYMFHSFTNMSAAVLIQDSNYQSGVLGLKILEMSVVSETPSLSLHDTIILPIGKTPYDDVDDESYYIKLSLKLKRKNKVLHKVRSFAQ